jgi:acetyltransferase-like isoleucine patch superfamily enzyme
MRRCRIASTAIITDKENLQIEDNVWINHYARIDAAGGVLIGEGCQIGYGSCVLSHSTSNSIRLMGGASMEYSAKDRIGYVARKTSIGRYTFIGGGSFIMPGVTVGKGCVIGVNSVVTHDVPDYAIVVGSPAKVIGSTKDIDKKYLSDPIVQQNYYDLKNI